MLDPRLEVARADRAAHSRLASLFALVNSILVCGGCDPRGETDPSVRPVASPVVASGSGSPPAAASRRESVPRLAAQRERSSEVLPVASVVPDPQLVNLTRIPPDTEIELKRGSCLGTCQTYNLGVDARGGVTFYGIGNTEALGERTRRIPQSAVLDLLRRFGRIGFLSITPELLLATCGRPPSDGSSATISLKTDGKTNTVDYYGCHGNALGDGLGALEKQIDRVLALPAWIRHRPKKPAWQL